MIGDEVSERALALWRSSLVVDLHNDLPTRVLDDDYDPDVRHPAGFARGLGHTDVPRLVESGVAAQWLAAFVDAPYAERAEGASFARAMQMIHVVHALSARHPASLALATTGGEVRAARDAGRVALLVAVEGGHAIESSLERLRDLHAAGARYMTLTWNNGTAWAGAAQGLGGTRTGGLTPFGCDVVREMNRLGMLVDVSHVSEATFWDALDASADPVIASHSNARALCDHWRNLRDEQLRAVGESGGVVGLNFFSEFVDPEFGRRERRAPLALLAEHAERIAEIAGADHVALGSDFDGIRFTPEGLDDVTCVPSFVQRLLHRGWREEEVRKLLGENAMRVMQRVLDRG
ncbi:MAG: dipeptidase [Gemmatimonadaceae bacterium]